MSGIENCFVRIIKELEYIVKCILELYKTHLSALSKYSASASLPEELIQRYQDYLQHDTERHIIEFLKLVTSRIISTTDTPLLGNTQDTSLAGSIPDLSLDAYTLDPAAYRQQEIFPINRVVYYIQDGSRKYNQYLYKI